MTDNEIIKALEICTQIINYDTFTYKAVKRGLDLINRQKAEIDRLKNELHGKVDYIHEQREVIDDLKDKYNKKGLTVEVAFDKEQLEKIAHNCVKGYELQINENINEAIREFAKRVKMAFYYEFEELIPSIMADKIDEIVKEMTEGEK